MKPSVLVAAGCSWVSAKYIDRDPNADTIDFEHVEDPAVVSEYSFAGQLQRRLGFDQLELLASSGSNNDQQSKRIVEFVDNNRDKYSSIFVLWGLTSLYRWDMYSESTEDVKSCVYGMPAHRSVRSQEKFEQEVKTYFTLFWNREYELEKLGQKVLLLDGYLNSLKINHLFFNSFQSYTDQDLKIKRIGDNHFYNIKQENNDMLSLLQKHTKIKTNKNKNWLNLFVDKDKQLNGPNIKDLQNSGWLDRATAHPTIKSHRVIADKLYDFVKEKHHGRI